MPLAVTAAESIDRPRGASERSATAKQVRALEQLASRLGLRLEEWLQERLGATHLAELSLEEASGLIEELQQLQRPALAG